MLQGRPFLLHRKKMLSFLDEMETAAADDGITLYLPGGLAPAEIDRLLQEVPASGEISLSQTVAASKTGAVLFWNPQQLYLILPPFPIGDKSLHHGVNAAPLRSLLLQNFRTALVLVRLGAYAIGICHGEAITSRKAGTGLVHARHKKGGSSQGRFQRHREKQIEAFLTRVCGHVREQLEPEARSLDYLVYGGAWTTILLLQKRCPFLKQFADRLLPPLLEIEEPRRAMLDSAVSRVWSSRVYHWHEA